MRINAFNTLQFISVTNCGHTFTAHKGRKNSSTFKQILHASYSHRAYMYLNKLLCRDKYSPTYVNTTVPRIVTESAVNRHCAV